MPVLADFCAHVYSEIVYCFEALNDFLADTLRPLKPYLLANLKEAKSSLTIPWVLQGAQETFEE
jgi:hypothetical protein